MVVTVNNDEFLWVEKYRPTTVDECILPERIKSWAKNILTQGEMPNVMFHGGAGSGKTTLAKAICNELECDYIVINASDENGIDTLRTKMTAFASAASMNGKPRVIIVDESDGWTPQVQAASRGFLEAFSKNCRFIFTCNFKDKLIAPLHSRLIPVDYTLTKEEKKQVATSFFKRTCEILDTEQVEYDKKVIAKVIEKHFPDFRRVLGELQKYANQTGNQINEGVLASIRDVNLDELVISLRDKDFDKMRGWVVANLDSDINTILRKVYVSLKDIAIPAAIPNIILILSDYMYKAAFVADREILLVACLTELMSMDAWK